MALNTDDLNARGFLSPVHCPAPNLVTPQLLTAPPTPTLSCLPCPRTLCP